MNSPEHEVEQQITPKSWLGLQLVIGLLIIFFSALAFAEIAHSSGANQPLATLDKRAADWSHLHATSVRTNLAFAASFFGSVRFLSFATAVTAFAFWRWKVWNRLLVLVLAMSGEGILNLALKHAFHRQRPALENPLVTLSSYGFPSGHTMGATVFYGLIAMLAAQRLRTNLSRVLVLLGAACIIAAIGTSRVYLGAHFFSDVTGAIAAGTAWLFVCWTGLETIRGRRRRVTAQRST